MLSAAFISGGKLESRIGPPGEARKEPDTQRAVLGADSVEGPPEKIGQVRVVSRDVPHDPAGVAKRCSGELFGCLGLFRPRPERGVGCGRVPRPRLGVAQRQQELAPLFSIGRVGLLEEAERRLVEARRLLVCEQIGCSLAGTTRVRDSLPRVSSDLCSLGEVMSELREMGVEIDGTDLFERLADLLMELHPARAG